MSYPYVVGPASGSTSASPGTSHTIPLPTPALAGDRIVVVLQFGGAPVSPTWPSGWTSLSAVDTPVSNARQEIRYRECDGTEGSSITVSFGGTGCSSASAVYLIRDHDPAVAPVVGTATGTATTSATPPDPPSLTSGFGAAETLWLAIGGGRLADSISAPSGYSDLAAAGDSSPTTGCYVGMAWKQTTATSENPGTMALSFYAADRGWVAATVAIKGIIPPFTADFSGTPRSGGAPLSVAFTDESSGGTGTADTWLWDFGDGETSTSQNPTHIYAFQGSYNVTLTVSTDDDESDSLTRTAYITATGDYVAPEPGGAILEIYAGATGAARWGSAHWGQDVWNSAGWVDVTPQGITVVIRWGSHSPERGVLAETEAATWLVTTYDPDRLMDPGNDDSPYHTDLVAGLPIRLRHRGTVIRQGYAERIAYFHADKQGAIRATDNVSLMARTPVPADSVVADTLRARARDVIAAAGLRITVEPDPPSGDPALAPRIEGDRSVWRHVADAAEQTLHMVYVDRLGTLKFRPWDTPYDRARGVDETNLVDLGTQVDLAGLFSVVQAVDSITESVVERRLTPTPKWGAVVYSRDELTIDAGDWAAAVLADRSLQTVQWIPGMIWPLTADEVEYFATLEAVERLAVDHRETDPEVNITGIIVGGEIHVTGKRESAALWSFELELAQTAESPLYTDTDPPEFLRNEAGDGYLYAD